jgi:16S rRNA (guanine(966)-N(2))-methyltransferase RsmD
MRVIAGEFRSRRLKSLPGLDVRPTPDRLRETLFAVLTPVIEGAKFVDAYAGVGAVGIEALSRGAREAIFIEKSREAVDIIRENLATLGLRERGRLIKGKAAALLAREQADIVFLDPPYDRETEYQEALAAAAQSGAPLVIAQHSTRLKLSERYGVLARYREIRQGDNQLTLFRREDANEPPR